MPNRRLLLALPLLLACPARAEPEDDLAQLLVICWAARGVRFTPQAVRERIGTARGRAALLAVAGATTNADGDGEETAVEILWDAGRPALPTEPLLHHDLARGLPLLLMHRDGRALLMTGLAGSMAQARTAAADTTLAVPLADVLLIGRPVIAGA